MRLKLTERNGELVYMAFGKPPKMDFPPGSISYIKDPPLVMFLDRCIHGPDCELCKKSEIFRQYNDVVKRAAYKKRCELWMQRIREIRGAIKHDTNVDSHSDAQ